jgi:hypothetical protein
VLCSCVLCHFIGGTFLLLLLNEHAPLHSVILHAMVHIKQLVQKSSVVDHHTSVQLDICYSFL